MDFIKRVKIFHIVAILLAITFLAFGWVFFSTRISDATKLQVSEVEKEPVIETKLPIDPKINSRPKPASVSMKRMKSQGCVTDGLLSEYNPDWQEYVDLINRSNCYYLHRAIETWLKPPDFETIDFEMSQIKKKNVVYGMFLAEAIDTKAKYFNNNENRFFDFEKMCREGSVNPWGEHTCKPDFASKEYRDYLEYITHWAIDLGVQSFTFGQIYMQEGANADYAPRIVKDMREYAKKKGVDIVIGAQTGNIQDEKYLQLFDYIEGGVGIDGEGNVEDGPCLSKRGGCWALLWHSNYAEKAKNVLLHLDWSGIKSDDLDIFARMTQEKRAETLKSLYGKFNSEKTGFLMPVFGVLASDNGGCRGPKKKFYSSDSKYTCRDEKVINEILSKK